MSSVGRTDQRGSDPLARWLGDRAAPPRVAGDGRSYASGLLRFAAGLGRASDEYEAALLVAHGVADLVGAAFTAIYLVRFDGSVELAAIAGRERPAEPVVDALARRAIDLGELVRADHDE